MIDLLIVLLAYVGLSYLWSLYVRPNYPVVVDTWYDKAISYPVVLIKKYIVKS